MLKKRNEPRPLLYLSHTTGIHFWLDWEQQRHTIMQIDKNEVEKAIYFTFSWNTKNRLSCKLNSTKLKICFSEVYNTNQYVLYLYIPFKTKANIVTSDLALDMILFDLLIQIYFSRAIFFIYSISQAIESKKSSIEQYINHWANIICIYTNT